MTEILPTGKLPADLLARLLGRMSVQDARLLVGPGVGLDCAIIESHAPGDDQADLLWVLKSDPITFATDAIGWYAVQVNANDIATSGADPRWLMATLLLPEGKTTPALVEQISQQLFDACQEIGVAIIGGHTEITYGLDRPILVCTMIGEVQRQQLITPRGVQPGDRLLLAGEIPVEATAILGREFAERLLQSGALNESEIAQAAGYLYQPGISVLRAARLARQAGRIHAMHDPTEGGLYMAVWELAEASQLSLLVDPSVVKPPALPRRICQALGIDPLAAIASGALLLAVPPSDTAAICQALCTGGIPCLEIGQALEPAAPPLVYQPGGEGRGLLPRPERDEIARLFET